MQLGRIIFICSLFISWSVPAFSAPKIAPNIYYSSERHSYIADGKLIPSYFWSGRIDFGNTFDDVPEAKTHYEQYKALMRWFPYLNWGALVALAGYTIARDGKDFDPGTGWTVFIVPWFSGILVASKANFQLNKAINIYNGVQPKDARSSPSLQSERPLVLTYQWTF